MSRSKPVVGIAGIAYLLTACTQSPSTTRLTGATDAPATKRQLMGTAIAGRIAGRRFQWIRARDMASGETTFSNDGVMTWRRLDIASSGEGRWSVEGNNLCQHYDPTPQWKGGRVCRVLYEQGSTLTTGRNGGGLVTYTEVPST